MELRVAGKYRVCKYIDRGSFGALYQGVNIKTNEEVAIKLEKITCEKPMLLYEAKLYERFQGGAGFPTLYWYGVEGDFNCMVVEILGPTV